MHVAGFVIAVPEGAFAAYRHWAERSAALFEELGCIETMTAWEDNVPDGDQTDFRRAVAAKPGEKIVFAWQIWPDKATMDAAEDTMRADPRFDLPATLPFDPKRILIGSFRPIQMSRSAP